MLGSIFSDRYSQQTLSATTVVNVHREWWMNSHHTLREQARSQHLNRYSCTRSTNGCDASNRPDSWFTTGDKWCSGSVHFVFLKTETAEPKAVEAQQVFAGVFSADAIPADTRFPLKDACTGRRLSSTGLISGKLPSPLRPRRVCAARSQRGRARYSLL